MVEDRKSYTRICLLSVLFAVLVFVLESILVWSLRTLPFTLVFLLWNHVLTGLMAVALFAIAFRGQFVLSPSIKAWREKLGKRFLVGCTLAFLVAALLWIDRTSVQQAAGKVNKNLLGRISHGWTSTILLVGLVVACILAKKRLALKSSAQVMLIGFYVHYLRDVSSSFMMRNGMDFFIGEQHIHVKLPYALYLWIIAVTPAILFTLYKQFGAFKYFVVPSKEASLKKSKGYLHASTVLDVDLEAPRKQVSGTGTPRVDHLSAARNLPSQAALQVPKASYNSPAINATLRLQQQQQLQQHNPMVQQRSTSSAYDRAIALLAEQGVSMGKGNKDN